MIFLIPFVLLLNCGPVDSHYATESQSEISKNEVKQEDGYLQTGWYYLSNKESGIARKLKGTEELVYLDPKPIATVKNFSNIEIYQSNSGDFGLTIKLDKEGTKAWSVATGKSIGEKLALVIDDQVFYTPTVNSQIDFGITALNRGDLTEVELRNLQNKIEKEKKAKP